MVNPNTIESILNNLKSYQAKLSILADYSRQAFLEDFTKIESTKHLLQVSVQCCLDIAYHIIADAGYRTPQDSYEAFVVLNEEAILPDEFMPTLRQMVGFRNRTVHLYWDVDDAVIYDILQHSLGDFQTFVSFILSFMEKQSK